MKNFLKQLILDMKLLSMQIIKDYNLKLLALEKD